MSAHTPICRSAETARAAAANYPRNAHLREDLVDLLGPVTKLTQVDDATYSAHLHDLQLLQYVGSRTAPSPISAGQELLQATSVSRPDVRLGDADQARLASSDVSLPTHKGPMVLLTFRCPFRQLLPLKRGYRQQGASSLGVCEFGNRRNVRGSNALQDMVSSGWHACSRERPHYPPPRSGNAFAAAVVGATADLLLLIALFEWLAP